MTPHRVDQRAGQIAGACDDLTRGNGRADRRALGCVAGVAVDRLQFEGGVGVELLLPELRAGPGVADQGAVHPRVAQILAQQVGCDIRRHVLDEVVADHQGPAGGRADGNLGCKQERIDLADDLFGRLDQAANRPVGDVDFGAFPGCGLSVRVVVIGQEIVLRNGCAHGGIRIERDIFAFRVTGAIRDPARRDHPVVADQHDVLRGGVRGQVVHGQPTHSAGDLVSGGHIGLSGAPGRVSCGYGAVALHLDDFPLHRRVVGEVRQLVEQRPRAAGPIDGVQP